MEVAADMAARHFSEKSPSGGVRDTGGGEFFLGFPHHRDLGDAVDAIGNHVDVVRLGHLKGMAGGEAALFHGGCSERGKPDDITRRIDVGNGRLVLGVDCKLPLRISGKADRGEVQCVRIADPSHGVEQHVGGHCLAVVELDRRVPGFIHADAQMLLSESDCDPLLLHLGVEGLRDFLIQEPQQLRPPIDESDLYAEGG